MAIQPANIDHLIDAYRAGLDTAEAAALAGIARRTVDSWRSSPQNDAQSETAARIEQAIAEYARETLAAISASLATDWRAAAWTMEHLPQFRERYGSKAEPEADAVSVQVLAALSGLLAAREQVRLSPSNVIDVEAVD